MLKLRQIVTWSAANRVLGGSIMVAAIGGTVLIAGYLNVTSAQACHPIIMIYPPPPNADDHSSCDGSLPNRYAAIPQSPVGFPSFVPGLQPVGMPPAPPSGQLDPNPRQFAVTATATVTITVEPSATIQPTATPQPTPARSPVATAAAAATAVSEPIRAEPEAEPSIPTSVDEIEPAGPESQEGDLSL